jgi:coiled-coil and C2 domain-containing protein 1
MDANPNIERSFPTSGNGPEINVTKQSVTNIAPAHKPSMSKQRSLTVQEKQLALLEKRQAMFKSAALEAKRAGQIEQAKEYLRSSKGFDKLIEASKGGLPVDISTLPVPPQSITSKFQYMFFLFGAPVLE